MITFVTVITFTIFVSQRIQCANILFVSTMSSPSHHVWNKALALGLVAKGHNVTSLTHLSEATPIKNWTLITIEGLYNALPELFDMEGLQDSSVLEWIKLIYDYPKVVCEYDMESKGLQTLLNYNNDAFNLIVFDATLGQCMYPLIEKFNNPPTVALYLLPLLISRSFGSHVHTSYMPYFSTSFTHNMTFKERLLNFLYLQADYLYFKYIAQPTEYKIAQKRFGKDIRPFDEVERSMSLVLTNIDPNFDGPISLSPNVIPLGGLHIKAASKLPEDLQAIFDGAENGVVLVSFGTNVKSEEFEPDMLSSFMKAFEQLNQIVIWKINATTDMIFPKNVVPRKWLPQGDVLGHRNLKAFVSQCGVFSSQEALYHGVPLVAMPMLIDQYTITQRLVERRLAVELRYLELTTEKIYGAITEVLHNPIYRENMKKASARYRDWPQPPLERGIYWIEYVLRHGDAENLVPIARDMPGYQLANLDVYLFLISCLILIYSICVFVLTGCRFLVTYGKVHADNPISK